MREQTGRLFEIDAHSKQMQWKQVNLIHLLIRRHELQCHHIELVVLADLSHSKQVC